LNGRNVLVVANRQALDQGSRLLAGRVLENVVEEVFLREGTYPQAAKWVGLGPREHAAWIGPRLVAVVVRHGKTGAGRRRWLVRRLAWTDVKQVNGNPTGG
jgi:hypothetical protein